LKRIVVEASVVLAGLFRDGSVRDLLLNHEGAQFLAPAYLTEEVERHLAEVVARTEKPAATVRAVFEDLLAALDLVAPGVYATSLERASALARKAGAGGDTEYLALALHFRAPVWTLDRDFLRAPGIRVLRTADVEREGST
jgi:predicted nucleic acid-binding protein